MTNNKFQTNSKSKILNPKRVWNFGHLNFSIVWNSVRDAWRPGKREQRKGITLLLVALILSAILTISIGVFNVIFGQIQISGEAGDSFYALNAADRGIERMLYLDRVRNNVSDGDVEDNTNTIKPLSPQSGCYRIMINKAPNCGADANTCITIAGQYQCGAGTTRTVKRGFRVVY